MQAGADAVTHERGIITRVSAVAGTAAAERARIDIAGCELAAVKVFRPFPNHAVHIVNPPEIGLALADIAQAAPPAAGIPVQNPAVVALFVRAVGFGFGGQSGIFPFVNGGQAFAD